MKSSSAYYHWIVLAHKNELILVENIEFTRQKKNIFSFANNKQKKITPMHVN